MVTGWPFMASRIDSKSARWSACSSLSSRQNAASAWSNRRWASGRSSSAACCASARRRRQPSALRNMRFTSASRSGLKNMCSVRHRPMPSAPNWRARRASSGVSALVRTPSLRSSSAQASTVANSSPISGSTSATSSTVMSPVVPSMAIGSPSLRTVSPAVIERADRSMASSEAPQTQGRPMPRATSAACDAFPPSLVRMPRAAWKPATSSASVNGRTRTTSRPSSAAATASGALKTIAPLAAPGEAATPRASTRYSAAGSKVGCSSASRLAASTVSSASSRPSSPSRTASTANRTAAWAGRLALRVCSMYRRPSSIVNSTSCMSR